jgi:hypothetical protein
MGTVSHTSQACLQEAQLSAWAVYYTCCTSSFAVVELRPIQQKLAYSIPKRNVEGFTPGHLYTSYLRDGWFV